LDPFKSAWCARHGFDDDNLSVVMDPEWTKDVIKVMNKFALA
jgi:hypothetical protein